MDWITLNTPEDVAKRCCIEIQQCAEKALAKTGKFKIVLAGGSTPSLAYKLLAESNTDFSGWEFYIGDERCLPVDHDERNSKLATSILLKAAGIPSSQLYPIPTELGPEAAADQYEAVIKSALPFDCVLLGLGEDGHTASLFPGHTHPADRLSIPVYNSPKPPSERVSLSFEAIHQSETILFIVTGSGKKEAVNTWKTTGTVPAAKITSKGNIKVLIDSAAAE